jgi:hypothetical protein
LYRVNNDQVVELAKLPKPESGAPSPQVFATEHTIWLTYFISESDPWYEKKYSKIWSDSDEECKEDCFAVVQFKTAHIHMFGGPSEETIVGHPLAERGLESFRIGENINSTWINELEEMDSFGHSRPACGFLGARHFIFAFHDSMFECVAKDLKVYIRHGDMLEGVGKILRAFDDGLEVPVSLEKSE